MVRANGEVLIARARDVVFAALADPARIPAWRPEILEVSPLVGHGLGARYQETMRFMGRKQQTFEVVEYEPGKRLAVQAVDGFSLRPLQRFLLDAEGEATRLRYQIELPVRGGFILMRPMLALMIPKKWRAYAQALKASVEAEATGR